MIWIGLDGTSDLASMPNKRADNAGFGAAIFLVLCLEDLGGVFEINLVGEVFYSVLC